MNYSESPANFGGEASYRGMSYGQAYHHQGGGYQSISCFQCLQCPKSFVQKEQLDRHSLSHDLEEIATSSGQASNNEINIEASKQENETTPKKKRTPVPKVPTDRLKLHACDQCDKSYTRKDHLNRHKLWHIGDRPHVCSVCFKSFIRKDKLTRHERIHDKLGVKDRDRECACLTCGKKFLRKNALKKHLESHEGPEIVAKETKSMSQQTDDVLLMEQLYNNIEPTKIVEVDTNDVTSE